MFVVTFICMAQRKATILEYQNLFQQTMRSILILLCFLVACADDANNRKHRFLLKGNAAIEDHSEDQAIRYFQEALKIDSCFADAHNNIGTVLFRQEKFEEALYYYNRAIKCNPEFLDGYFNRGNTLYELSRASEALQDIEKVLAAKPDTLAGLFLQGLIFTKMQEYTKANASFL